MIDVDRLRAVTHVFYHASCPDGTASAMICYEAFRVLHGPGRIPEFKSVQYHTDFFEKLEAGPGHLFVDITPPQGRWREWEKFNPIVLDHHESAKNVVEGLNGIYGENDCFSGARLAFEHVMLTCGWNSGYSNPWDEFSRLAMIRDTWKDEHPDFERASIQAYGLMTLGSSDLLDQLRDGKFDPGLITRMGEKDYGRAKFVADSARRYEVLCPRLGRPANVDVYNCTEKKLISDGCHHLLNEKGADLAVSYFLKHQDGKTTMVVSLRTRASFAGEVAKSLGGGGHANAAGFGLPDGHAMSMDGLASVLQSQMSLLQ